MRVRRIHLYRFRGFEDLQVQFPNDAKTIVFIGENGSGKTSLLEGISMILRESLYKHHRYDAVDWNNPLNVHAAHRNGSISIDIQGPKRSYDFTQSLTADRTRFISEEKVALQLGRDLIKEDLIKHYNDQARMAFDAKMYEKALEFYIKLSELEEEMLDYDSITLSKTYYRIGLCLGVQKKYEKSLIYFERSLEIQGKLESNDDLYLTQTYDRIAASYLGLTEYKKSLEYSEKSLSIKEKIFDSDNPDLATAYRTIGRCYVRLKEYEMSYKYFQKTLDIQEKILDSDNSILAVTFHDIGFSFAKKLENANKATTKKNAAQAIIFLQKALEIQEKVLNLDHPERLITLKNLSIVYTFIGDNEKSAYYKQKYKALNDDEKVLKENVPELYIRTEENILQHFNEYLDTWIPLVLHYSARQATIEDYKDALPIAFRIPMTTDFEMISDWFIEHENDENRKRLRVKSDYRGTELEAMREIITRGLNLLNGESESHFSELQTEIDEIVKDGQVTSYLSILKDGLRLNVNQLSDGEKRVFILLIDITRRLITAAKLNKESEYHMGGGIVLIDEIEQHLHPKWQRTLLPTLNKLFPNLQFIVTTHSPQVLSYVPNGCAFSLDNGKAYPQNTFGRNNEWILEAIMDDVNRPKEIQIKLDAYFDLIRENKLDAAKELRRELEDLIGGDEPELLKADILIRRKQKMDVVNEANS